MITTIIQYHIILQHFSSSLTRWCWRSPAVRANRGRCRYKPAFLDDTGSSLCFQAQCPLPQHIRYTCKMWFIYLRIILLFSSEIDELEKINVLFIYKTYFGCRANIILRMCALAVKYGTRRAQPAGSTMFRPFLYARPIY